jgi:Zn-dependent peptidase ImmA (M78 family)
MKEKIPVNPEVLKWARTSMGLTETAVARKLNKPVETIKEWESGLTAPTYPTLEKMAYELYKRPVAIFFFPCIPKEDGQKVDLRTLPAEIIETLPPEIIKIYRKAKLFQINLAELYDGKNPVDENFLLKYKMSLSTDIKLLVRNLRAELNITTDTVSHWKNYDAAIEGWRNLLESKGIFVFKDSFKNDSYSGLCIFDEKYPVIFVNNSMPKSRQIFTIFHELAHLLYRSGGIDVLSETFFRQLSGQYSKIEVKCNQFTGEFLLPESILKEELLIVNGKIIENLAFRFKVSKEVVLRRYLDLHLIDIKEYKDFTTQWKESFENKKDRAVSGGNYYLTQMVYLGKTYIDLAFRKYFQDKISIDNLADYLGIKVKNIPTFEDYCLR